jgi:type VI protein secretion system component VasF
VTGRAGEGDLGSADATYRQRAWLPWWAIAALVAVIALLLILLLS